MPSDSGSRRAASGGALERRKMATAKNSRTAATTESVLRVRRCIPSGQEQPSGLTLTPVARRRCERAIHLSQSPLLRNTHRVYFASAAHVGAANGARRQQSILSLSQG